MRPITYFVSFVDSMNSKINNPSTANAIDQSTYLNVILPLSTGILGTMLITRGINHLFTRKVRRHEAVCELTLGIAALSFAILKLHTYLSSRQKVEHTYGSFVTTQHLSREGLPMEHPTKVVCNRGEWLTPEWYHQECVATIDRYEVDSYLGQFPSRDEETACSDVPIWKISYSPLSEKIDAIGTLDVVIKGSDC